MSTQTKKIILPNPDFKHNQRFEYLLGKTIKRVRYMSPKEAEHFMWSSRPLIIEFTDGTFIWSQCDDEGNDGGAMFYLGEDNQDIIYTL